MGTRFLEDTVIDDEGDGYIDWGRDTPVPSFIGSTVLNVSDNQRASEFWRGALRYVPHPQSPDFLVPPGWKPPSDNQHDHADGVHLHLDVMDKMHLDLWVERGTTLDSEVRRLVALGASLGLSASL